MTKPPQIPGCLPEGYTLDSILSAEQWCIWMGYSQAYGRKVLRQEKGVLRDRKKPRVHVRTYLWAKGGAFRDAMEAAGRTTPESMPRNR